ncbi:MAG: LLM class flavin-dependent oxidoreductase [Chloroflexi bacterium]|nr:LLM class flavin-dependent oxidoreductase [Chloroflexota bacterium]
MIEEDRAMTLGTNIQVGIAIPQIFPNGPLTMASIRDFVGRAEKLGYHSLWVQEQVLGDTAVLEPLSLLSYAAALTSTVKLGVSVLVLPLHNPVHLAKRLSSIDQMSQGRLVVGLGLGGATTMYPALGLPEEARVRRFVEGVGVIKALLETPAAQYTGRFFRLDGVAMEPKPVQKPHPPIWFGGRHPNALRRAVRLADGWMGAGSSSIADFKEQAGTVRRLLEASRRDLGAFTISKRVYIAVDRDEARAERRLREWFGSYYRNADMASKVSVWGSPAHCLETLAEIVAAGATHLLLNPVFDQKEHAEGLAAQLRLGR